MLCDLSPILSSREVTLATVACFNTNLEENFGFPTSKFVPEDDLQGAVYIERHGRASRDADLRQAHANTVRRRMSFRRQWDPLRIVQTIHLVPRLET